MSWKKKLSVAGGMLLTATSGVISLVEHSVGWAVIALLILSAVAVLVWPRRRESVPDLEVWCQPTPGDRAWLVVRNNGGMAQVEASALVVKIENDPNQPRQQSYRLPWRGGSTLAQLLGNGSEDSLLLASSQRLEMDLNHHMFHMSVWERTATAVQEVDSSRWAWGTPGPVMTLEVTITLIAPSGTEWPSRFRSRPIRRTILVSGHSNGAVSAQQQADPVA